MTFTVRPERRADAAAVRALVAAAFRDAEHAGGAEAGIVDALRAAGALAEALVADEAGAVVGHVAFSPVTIDAGGEGWFGLGPLAVRKASRRRGIGAALVRSGIDRLRSRGARGCVVLGDPAYYGRFGFEEDPGLRLPGVPPAYFQRLVVAGPPPSGTVAYHPAFEGT